MKRTVLVITTLFTSVIILGILGVFTYKNNWLINSQTSETLKRKVDNYYFQSFNNNRNGFQDKFWKDFPDVMSWRPERIKLLTKQEQRYYGHKYLISSLITRWDVANFILEIKTFSGINSKIQFDRSKGINLFEQYKVGGLSKPLSQEDLIQPLSKKETLFCVGDIVELYFDEIPTDILTEGNVVKPDLISISYRNCP